MPPFRSLPPDAQTDALRREIDMHKKLLAEQPEDVACVAALADRLLQCAAYEVSRGATHEAEAAFGDALVLLRDALQGETVEAGLMETLSKTLAASGALYAAHADLDVAVQCLEEAVEIDEALYQADPSIAGRALNLIRSSERCGELQYERGAFETARGRLSQAVALRRRHVDEVEDLAQEFHEGALCLVKLGKAHVSVGAVPEGVECFRVAEGMLRTLVERLGSGPGTQYNLATVLAEIGDTVFGQGQAEEAKEAYDQAGVLLRVLFEGEPENRDWVLGFATLMKKSGHAASACGDQGQAVEGLTLALELERLALQGAPEDVAVQEALAVTLGALAELHDAAGMMIEARDFFQESLDIRRKLLDDEPERPRRREELAGALNDLGESLRKAGRFDEALPWFRESLELLQNLTELDPERPTWLRSLAVGQSTMAGVCMMLEDLTGAVSYNAASLELIKGLLARFPDHPAYRYDWAFGLVNQAQLSRICGVQSPSLQAFDQAISYADELAATHADNPEFSRLAARLRKDRELAEKE